MAYVPTAPLENRQRVKGGLVPYNRKQVSSMNSEYVEQRNGGYYLAGKHFELDGHRVTGKTAVGRTTIEVLAMNANDILLIRAELAEE
jgi:hypothetical protein